MVVEDNYAYLADRLGLFIIDVSNKGAPSESGFLDLPYGNSLDYQNGFVYMVRSDTILSIVDVHNPGLPVEVGCLTNQCKMNKIAVSGDYAYLTCSSHDTVLCVVDISNTSSPVGVGFIPSLRSDAIGVEVSGDYLFVGLERSGIDIYDIVTDPTSPGKLANYDGQNFPSDLFFAVALYFTVLMGKI